MSPLLPPDRPTFTVICRWHPPGDIAASWKFIAVGLVGSSNAQNAANNACLYLIWDRQGAAKPCFVLHGGRKVFVPDAGVFDAEEYAETLTFTGTIVSDQELKRLPPSN